MDINRQNILVIMENIPVFYLGEDAEDIKDIMPECILKSIFKRPIDVKVTAKIVDNYIKDYGTAEDSRGSR